MLYDYEMTQNPSPKTRTMPDVAAVKTEKVSTKINRVGMTNIEVPIVIEIAGNKYRSPAMASAFISLDDESTKGIHMSRLFSRLQELGDETINSAVLEKIVKSFQESHSESSESSELKLKFDLNLQKTSLISGMTGWRNYPVECILTYENSKVTWVLKYEVVYSSTCPCSAALSRQLIQEKFRDDFGKKASFNVEDISDWLAKEDSVCATPHSQRSFAKIEATMANAPKEFLSSFLKLIEDTEATLKTPVQSFVKRADEQEFARLNAENLMFCEDAARRIHAQLESDSTVAAYKIEVEHQESLHPHNAVARVWSSKN